MIDPPDPPQPFCETCGCTDVDFNHAVEAWETTGKFLCDECAESSFEEEAQGLSQSNAKETP